MRLFIGVWLSVAMQKEVIDCMNLLMKDNSGFKWTNPSNLHFTIKFLGEIPESQLNHLKQALKSAAAQNVSFQLKLGDLGFSPPKGAPRIIWLGVTSGQGLLIKLAESIESNCLRYGFSKSDKPFKPHLTIARAKSDTPLVQLPLEPLKSVTDVTGFSLIESHLFSTGPVYKTLENYDLGG